MEDEFIKVDIPTGKFKEFYIHKSMEALVTEFRPIFENMKPDPHFPSDNPTAFISEIDDVKVCLAFMQTFQDGVGFRNNLYCVTPSFYDDWMPETEEQMMICGRLIEIENNNTNPLYGAMKGYIAKKYGI